MSNKNIFAIIEIILAILFIVECSIIGLGFKIVLIKKEPIFRLLFIFIKNSYTTIWCIIKNI